MTYRDLNARADRLAGRLLESGIAVGDRVVICMEDPLRRLVSVLGTMKAGAAYVPVDPATPRARFSRMIADCGARLVVVDPGQGTALSEAGTVAVLAPEVDGELPGLPHPAPAGPGGRAPRRPRVHHLYFGLDRRTERCGRHPPLAPSPGGGPDPGVPHRSRQPCAAIRRVRASTPPYRKSSRRCWRRRDSSCAAATPGPLARLPRA